jgi:cytochrome c oxidase assembly factor CtaG
MTKIPIRKFAYLLIVFSVFVAASGALFQWLAPKYASPAIPFIVIFFFFITLLTLYIVLRSPFKTAGRKFIAGYMLSRIVKMFSTLIFLVLYLIFNEADRWNFTGAFLVIYFAYSIFEIFALKKDQ